MNDEVNLYPQYKGPLKTIKVGNQVFKSAYDCELTEEDLEKATRELGETEEKKEQCLRELKEKLSKESNVKVRQDDFFLLRYLRVRKYNVTKAYQNLMLFYDLRRKHRDCLPISPEMEPFQSQNIVTCLPYLDGEGRVVFLFNLNRWDPEETTFEEFARIVANVLDIISMNPKCQINGICGIYNFSGITLKHVFEALKNGRLFMILSILQHGYPWRIKILYFINTNGLFRILFRTMKPMLHNKVAQRSVFLGSDMNELHQHIHPVFLPKSLQGSLEEEELDISQHVFNNLSYIRYERSFGYL